jgi:hypothetical protein
MRDRSSLEARFNRRQRAREGAYREDCTDGQYSVLNPVTFKGDALVQVWIDSRELATISKWLDKTGNYTRFLSEVVKEGIHMACEDLVRSGEVELVEDTTEARGMLERKYKINLNPNGRGEKNVLHNIILSERKRLEVPDELRELQKKTKENYTKMEKEGVFKGGGSIFDELVALERGGNNAKPIEDEDE